MYLVHISQLEPRRLDLETVWVLDGGSRSIYQAQVDRNTDSQDPTETILRIRCVWRCECITFWGYTMLGHARGWACHVCCQKDAAYRCVNWHSAVLTLDITVAHCWRVCVMDSVNRTDKTCVLTATEGLLVFFLYADACKAYLFYAEMYITGLKTCAGQVCPRWRLHSHATYLSFCHCTVGEMAV